jgi:hypothetical protein
LRQEAAGRVSLPQEGLQRTSQAAHADMTYQAVVESGTDCEWSKSFENVNELNEMYEDRLRSIDEAGGGGTEIKLRLLQ